MQEVHFFYSPFTDSYYTVRIEDHNMRIYQKQGKELPFYPSLEGFTRLDTSVRADSIRTFYAIPSIHSQNMLN